MNIISEADTKTKGPQTTFDLNLDPHNAGSVTTTTGQAKKDLQVPGKQAGASKTRVSVKPINDPRAGQFMRDLSNIDATDDISDAEAARNAGHTPTTQGAEPVPPTPENLPAVISTAIANTGETIIPEWHMVKHLPGYMQNAIRAVGRSVFGQFTDTPLEKIQVLSTLSNSETEVRGMMAWIKHNGIRDDRAELDFAGSIPGYGADVQLWNVVGYTFMLVKDFAGYYIYGWPGGRGVHVDNTKMKQIASESENHGISDKAFELFMNLVKKRWGTVSEISLRDDDRAELRELLKAGLVTMPKRSDNSDPEWAIFTDTGKKLAAEHGTRISADT